VTPTNIPTKTDGIERYRMQQINDGDRRDRLITQVHIFACDAMLWNSGGCLSANISN
jgi:hypothetical protein